MRAERERRRRRKLKQQDGPHWKFRGAALEAQSIMAPEFILSGPSETGKTLATLCRADALARRHPGLQGAFVRKVRADMDGTVLQIWKQNFSDTGWTAFGGERPEWFDYPNGSRIWVGGMDRPGKTLSGARDFVYVNQAEELSLDDWETLSTRTTGRAGVLQPGILFGDCNPGPAHHWIKQRAGLALLESRHEDNPSLFDDDGQITAQGKLSMAALDRLTGVRRERLRFGRWVSAEGAVYEYDAAVHLVDAFEVPPDWRRFRSIDFGYTNPFVCQWWAIDGDARMYLYREIYMTGRTVRAHAEQIKALEGWGTDRQERIETTITDHDAEDRATLDECGIDSVPAFKDISPGIQVVQERLKPAGDGKPRLFVMRGALAERDESLANARKPVCTEQEFDAYAWPKSSDGRPVKEVPVKLFDHGMDAMRYAACYVGDFGGGPLFYE